MTCPPEPASPGSPLPDSARPDSTRPDSTRPAPPQPDPNRSHQNGADRSWGDHSADEGAVPDTDREKWYKRVGNRLRVLRRRPAKLDPAEPNPHSGLRIMIVTDAWAPQVNGVVRTLEALKNQLERMGNEVAVIAPTMFRTVALPTYQEIRLALWANRPVARMINDMRPHAIHIATEGPLGLAARRFCLRRDHPFTTSLHTRFPEYIHARTGFPISWGYWFLRLFHKPASAVMVAAPSVRDEMEERGFQNLRLWSRGVDIEAFKPLIGDRDAILPYRRPIWLSVGRIAVEKNIEAFLRLDLPGTKVVVGDGPLKASLQNLYPDTVFLGARFGDDLARIYGASDVFVFPSRTDTFGLVNVEALACGTPVAAYPVHGPKDIITVPNVGALDEDLAAACQRALTESSRTAAREHALTFSWEACTRQFLINLDLPGFDEAYWAESAKLPD